MPAFKGWFTVNPPLTEEHKQALLEFNCNSPTAPGTPSRRCQWEPTEDGTGIRWDGGEKFWAFKEWLVYLIEHLLEPQGYQLSGEVKYDEEYDSFIGGVIYVQDNQLEVVPALIPNSQRGPSQHP